MVKSDSSHSRPSLVLVGCGHMGQALLQGWLRAGICDQASMYVIDPQDKTVDMPQLAWYKDLEALPASLTPDIVLFAVKPQQLVNLLPYYSKRFGAAPLYISIAAGKSTDFFRQHLGESIRIVRAMPNIPARIGHGIIALYATEKVTKTQKNVATGLMEGVGEVIWLTHEQQMDAVTAISGSGPAYVYLFIECLVKAGIAVGLGEALAKALVQKTVSGSLALAENSTESLRQLRRNVTSPGGTTEAALEVLMRNNVLETLLKDAVLAAVKKSQALAE